MGLRRRSHLGLTNKAWRFATRPAERLMASASAATLIALGHPAQAEPAPDYVMTRKWNDAGKRTETVLHHGGRFRIAFPAVGGEDVKFIGPDPRVRFTGLREPQGPWISLMIFRDARPQSPARSARKPTGEQRTIIGERCLVWRAEWRGAQNEPLDESGCTTADGVDLWIETSRGEQAFATRLERRPVRDEDVAPPYGLLDPRTWVPADPQGDTAAAHADDFEVELASTPNSSPTAHHLGQIMRRSGPWIVAEDRGLTVDGDPGKPAPSRRVTHISEDILLVERRDERQSQSLSILRRRSFAEPPRRDLSLPDDVMLGRRCVWWIASPNFSASWRECRTQDGMLLKTLFHGLVTTELAAVRLRRSQVPLSEILPDKSIATAQAWEENDR
jgi:hypothetical protein